ncbi:hypothetical protein MHYP_G00123420 [Metynnis hypsauchen]
MSSGQPKKIKLSDGSFMPLLGQGTFNLKVVTSGRSQEILEEAIDAGYRHLDTAIAYQTEVDVGNAVRSKIQQGVIKREDMFIVSKDVGDELFPKKDGKTLTTDFDYVDVWKGMEVLKASGKVKSIGVSNFSIPQLERLLSVAEVPPVVNQVELHPYLVQSDLIKYCKSKNIALTAYFPFGSPDKPKELHAEPRETDPGKLLEDPVVGKIAAKHKRTPAQVLLRYHIEQDIAVIPKGINSSQIQENIKVFDFSLDEEDMRVLKSLNRGWRGATFEDMKTHRFYPF